MAQRKQRINTSNKKISQTAKKTAQNSNIRLRIIENLGIYIEHKSVAILKYSRPLEIILLAGIIATGIVFRLEDLGSWRNSEQKAFFNNQPLHTTFDAWFYLSLAKDIADGTYNPVDEKRGVPDSPIRRR